MGILPDKEYESNINSLVLDYFNIIKLLMTRDVAFNKLFNGDNIVDVLMEQKYGPAKKKIGYWFSIFFYCQLWINLI